MNTSKYQFVEIIMRLKVHLLVVMTLMRTVVLFSGEQLEESATLTRFTPRVSFVYLCHATCLCQCTELAYMTPVVTL